MIRERLQQVLPEHTTGAVRGKNLVYDMTGAHRAQMAFDDLSKSDFAAMRRGVSPNPDLDRMIADSFRSRIAGASEAIPGLKSETGAAIQRHQALRKEANRIRDPEVERLRNMRRELAAAARARLPGQGSTIGFSQLGIRTPAARDALDIAGKALQSRAVSAGARQSPRLTDFIINQLLMNTEPNQVGGSVP